MGRLYRQDSGGDLVIKSLLRRLFVSELLEEYARGVKDGVNQYNYDRESALWMVDEYSE